MGEDGWWRHSFRVQEARGCDGEAIGEDGEEDRVEGLILELGQGLDFFGVAD